MSEQVENEVPEPTSQPVTVTVTDIRIPFNSIFVLLIKLALAAVPAGLLLVLSYTAARAVLDGIGR